MIWWIEAHCTICPTKVLLAEISAESNLSLEANVNRKVEFIKIMRARAKEKQSAFAFVCVCTFMKKEPAHDYGWSVPLYAGIGLVSTSIKYILQ